MVELSLLVFVGVFLVAFNQELLKWFEKTWKKESKRNGILFVLLTLLLYAKADVLAECFVDISQVLANFASSLALNSKHAFLIQKSIYCAYLIIIPSILSAVVYGGAWLVNRQKYIGFSEFLWFFWVCLAFMVSYLT